MRLSRYIELAQARISNALLSSQVNEYASTYPCKCCEGSGRLVTYSKFVPISRAASSHQPLTDKHGKEIVCVDTIVCPPCSGTGVDELAMLEGFKKTEREMVA